MDSGDLWLWGCIGGALPALLLIAKATFTDKAAFVLSGHLIIGIIVMVFLGGLVVNLVDLSGIEVPHATPELVVVLVGAGAVTILNKLIGIVADQFTEEQYSLDYAKPSPGQNLAAFFMD